MGHALRLTPEQVVAHKKRTAKLVRDIDAFSVECLGRVPIGKIVKTGQSEHVSQVQVIDWWSVARHKWLLPEFALFAIPNAAKRSFALANYLQREGLRKGIPDLMLAVQTEVTSGLFIEMKAGKNKPTDDQKAVISYLRYTGYHAVVAWSADEAVQAINGYLNAYEVGVRKVRG